MPFQTLLVRTFKIIFVALFFHRFDMKTFKNEAYFSISALHHRYSKAVPQLQILKGFQRTFITKQGNLERLCAIMLMSVTYRNVACDSVTHITKSLVSLREDQFLEICHALYSYKRHAWIAIVGLGQMLNNHFFRIKYMLFCKE